MGRALTREDEIYRETYFPYDPLKYRRLGNIIWELEHNAGVDFSLHDARRYVQTALEEAGIPESWARKIRGRKVVGSVAPYSQPEIDKLREAYRRALPYLMFVEKPTISEGDLRIKTHLDGLRGFLPEEVINELEKKYLGKPPEEAIPKISLEAEAVQRIADREGIDLREGAYMIPKDAIKREMKEIRKERTRPKIQTNGGRADCQRIVSEEELPSLLAQGWRVSAVLPSGKVVVENA